MCYATAPMRSVLIALLVVSGLGCSPLYNFTPTGPTASAAKPPTCTFRVTATLPTDDLEEIGVLEPVSFKAYDSRSFKQAIAADVCSVGGDVVVMQVNGNGAIVRGVVLVKKDRAAPATEHRDAR